MMSGGFGNGSMRPLYPPDGIKREKKERKDVCVCVCVSLHRLMQQN